jgi:hypothetical protein
MIRSAQRETNILERQFELDNNSSEILRIAREDFGMVEDKYIQKKFIKSRNEDRAVIADRNNGFIPAALGAFFELIRQDE